MASKKMNDPLETLALAIEKKELLTAEEREYLATEARKAIQAVKSAKEKCVLCGDAIITQDYVSGYVWKHFKEGFAHGICHEQHQLDKAAFYARCDELLATEYGRKEWKPEDYMTCACGHGSQAHKADELENLLECEGCDCDRFHYEVIDLDESSSIETGSAHATA